MTIIQTRHPITHCSNFTHLQRVTAWVLRFIHKCRARTIKPNNSPSLNIPELVDAERYWILLSQQEYFLTEIISLKAKGLIRKDSCLLPFCPFLVSSVLEVKRVMLNLCIPRGTPSFFMGNIPSLNSSF